MKTIADYQPHRLVRRAIDLLAGMTPLREPEGDAVWIVADLIRSDAFEQGILVSALGGEAEKWLAEAIEERAKLAR